MFLFFILFIYLFIFFNFISKYDSVHVQVNNDDSVLVIYKQVIVIQPF